MIGIDEVGRGAWAGPLLVVAARLKPNMCFPDGLTDSKLLSKKQRVRLYEQLLYVCEFGEGWVSSAEIDTLGLSASLRLGAANAFAGLTATEQEEVIIDGTVNFLAGIHDRVQTVVKAELVEPSVAAASVYAKVLRDTYMYKLHYIFHNFGFATNVGYGTAQHLDALKKIGITEHHRQSFKPMISMLTTNSQR